MNFIFFSIKSIIKFKESLKLYLLNNTLLINYIKNYNAKIGQFFMQSLTVLKSITVLIHCNLYSMYNQLINRQYFKILKNWSSMSIITRKCHNSNIFFWQ